MPGGFSIPAHFSTRSTRSVTKSHFFPRDATSICSRRGQRERERERRGGKTEAPSRALKGQYLTRRRRRWRRGTPEGGGGSSCCQTKRCRASRRRKIAGGCAAGANSEERGRERENIAARWHGCAASRLLSLPSLLLADARKRLSASRFHREEKNEEGEGGRLLSRSGICERRRGLGSVIARRGVHARIFLIYSGLCDRECDFPGVSGLRITSSFRPDGRGQTSGRREGGIRRPRRVTRHFRWSRFCFFPPSASSSRKFHARVKWLHQMGEKSTRLHCRAISDVGAGIRGTCRPALGSSNAGKTSSMSCESVAGGDVSCDQVVLRFP